MVINIQKIFGWIFIFLGMATIYFGVYRSYKMFQGELEVPALIKADNTQKLPPASSNPAAPEEQLNQMIGEQIKNILPIEGLIVSLNMLMWLVFVSVLIFAGGQAASIGIKMLRN